MNNYTQPTTKANIQPEYFFATVLLVLIAYYFINKKPQQSTGKIRNNVINQQKQQVQQVQQSQTIPSQQQQSNGQNGKIEAPIQNRQQVIDNLQEQIDSQNKSQNAQNNIPEFNQKPNVKEEQKQNVKQQPEAPKNYVQYWLDQLEQSVNANILLDPLNILYKITKNIADNPIEQKYRQIKYSNQTLRKRLFVTPMIKELILSLGFTQKDDVFELDNKNLGSLLENLYLVKMKADLIEAKLTSSEAYKDELIVQQSIRDAQKKRIEREKWEEQIMKELNCDRKTAQIKANKDSIGSVKSEQKNFLKDCKKGK